MYIMQWLLININVFPEICRSWPKHHFWGLKNCILLSMLAFSKYAILIKSKYCRLYNSQLSTICIVQNFELAFSFQSTLFWKHAQFKVFSLAVSCHLLPRTIAVKHWNSVVVINKWYVFNIVCSNCNWKQSGQWSDMMLLSALPFGGHLTRSLLLFILFLAGEVAWVTPGAFTIHNFPCSEDGKNCNDGGNNGGTAVGTHFYQDPSKDVMAVQRRLKEEVATKSLRA